MTTKITADNIEQATLDNLGSGPLISNVQIASNAYVVLDDTAVSLDGGFIIINGSKFDSNVNVLIDGTPAVSVSQISPSQIRAEVPPLSAGSKIVYLVNTDTGATAIRINGLTYSGFPTWVTGSTLPEGGVDELISIQLSATSDSNVSYSLAAGSSLPEGLTLAANGLLSGTITGLEDATIYNFTVEATDEELQNSPRSFSVTITAGDEFFKQTVLLLNGDGTNGAQNNTFLDSSTNNFTVTRNGDTTQGTFSPFSAPNGRWSNFFDGTTDWLTGPSANAAFNFGTGNFTFECFINPRAAVLSRVITSLDSTGSAFAFGFSLLADRSIQFLGAFTGSYTFSLTTSASMVNLNQWAHVAVVRDGANAAIFVNGVRRASSTTISANLPNSTNVNIGRSEFDGGREYFHGHISNLRVAKGTAVYDPTQTTLTVPTAPLTNITNTSLLTCQSNRFVDNSTNNFTITRNGDVRVTPFSPFAPTAAYSAGTNGGSGYFDGTGDSIRLASDINLALSGDFTIEFWFYALSSANGRKFINRWSGAAQYYMIEANGSNQIVFYFNTGSISITSSTAFTLNQWQHVAVSRSGSTITMYLNGTSVGTRTESGNNGSTSEPLFIGSYSDNTVNFHGYISNVRIVKGSAVYTSAFTPPTAPLTAITNTSLLLNFTNAGIIDATGRNNLETVGNAQIDTTTKKFGTGSMEFDGTGDYLIVLNSPENQLGTDTFTIEFWVYLASGDTGANRGLVAKGTSITGWLVSLNTTEKVVFTYSTSTITSSGAITTNAWNHIVVVREGTGSNQTKIYINGINDGTGTVTTDFNQTQALYIGADRSPGNVMKGFIDDLRITKGIARYTANFTPPTNAHRLK